MAEKCNVGMIPCIVCACVWAQLETVPTVPSCSRPSQVLLQPGSGFMAAGEQELCGAAGGAVNQPHRQLQDGRAGD